MFYSIGPRVQSYKYLYACKMVSWAVMAVAVMTVAVVTVAVEPIVVLLVNTY